MTAGQLFIYVALGTGGCFVAGLLWNLGKMAAIDIWTRKRTRNDKVG